MRKSKLLSRPLLSLASLSLWLVLGASPLRAATVFEQVLPEGWNGAICSGCNLGALADQRLYAGFQVDGPVTLTGLEFAVLNNSTFSLGDFSVSIWRQLDKQNDKPFREIVFGTGDYASSGPGLGFVNLSLPGWTLGKGSYYLSIYGIGDGANEGLQWGFAEDTGGEDDLVMRNDRVVRTDVFFGFSLFDESRERPQRAALMPQLSSFSEQGAEVPLPGTLGLFGLGLGALALTRRRKR